MTVWTLGLNHRTAPIELRERFSFASEQLAQSLCALRQRFDTHKEVAILSTCNRTEIYCAGDQVSLPQTLSWLADSGKTQVGLLQSHTYKLEGVASARHAFRVASGLDSMVLGESQILGQLKDAVRLAADSGSIGTTLNQMFQRSFAVAKEVRSTTEIGSNSISMAAASVRLATQLFENIKDTNVLFIGAGDMIELCVTHFAAKSPNTITIANRTVSRAQALADRVGGRTMALADISTGLAAFDIVVSCTASPHNLVELDTVKRALRQRKNRPIFMVDLAVPRDVAPSVKSLQDVYLYTVDDLTTVISNAQNQRQGAVVNAEVIIDEGVQKFMNWLSSRDHVPMIQQLNRQADAWRQVELTRARRRIEKGQDIDEVLECLSVGMMKKMLNGPLRELHHPENLQRKKALEAVQQMFLST